MRTDGDSRLPDVVLALDQEYVDILALLDRDAAVRRLVRTVPEQTGLDVAWVGEPVGADRMVLRNTVRTDTDLLNGLVVPVGAGLGGRVLTTRRPLFVRDYCAAPSITHHFNTQVAAERIKSMIAVPISRQDRLLGVLYAATRYETEFGDRVATALAGVADRAATAQLLAERARYQAELAVHEERRRLALQLHDTVGAVLFSLGVGIRALGEQDGLDEQVRTRLCALADRTAEAMAALRGSLHVLAAPPRPAALGVALREHCRAFEGRTGVSARVITLTDLPTLVPSRTSALADAAREALFNVEKHAAASSVVVSVFAGSGGVTVAVSDDGTGLPEPAVWPTGLGLRATAERLGRLGGTVTIAGNEDGGVTLRAWVPVLIGTSR